MYAVAMPVTALVAPGPEVTITLDGGEIRIRIAEDGIWMTGPTAHVFDGVWLG